MKHRNDAILLRIAQGDAFGLAAEYVSARDYPDVFAQLRAFDRYVQRPRTNPDYAVIPAGNYTDDTQMSCALAHMFVSWHDITSHGGHWQWTLDREAFLQGFLYTYHRDPRPGYASHLQHLLDESIEKRWSVTQFSYALKPASDRNGAAMRAIPCGIFSDPRLCVRLAASQAMVTHATVGGIFSAVAVALMTHFALYEEAPLSEMLDFCCRYCPEMHLFRTPWQGQVGRYGDAAPNGYGTGVQTAWALSTLLTTQPSLRAMAMTALDWEGDLDSLLALAWGIGSCRHSDEVLPDFLERDLEVGGQYGAAYLRSLGTKVMDVGLQSKAI